MSLTDSNCTQDAGHQSKMPQLVDHQGDVHGMMLNPDSQEIIWNVSQSSQDNDESFFNEGKNRLNLEKAEPTSLMYMDQMKAGNAAVPNLQEAFFKGEKTGQIVLRTPPSEEDSVEAVNFRFLQGDNIISGFN